MKRSTSTAFDGDPTTFFSNQFRQVNKDCWHQHLGHPHHQILDHLHSKKFTSFDSHSKSFEVNLYKLSKGKVMQITILA